MSASEKAKATTEQASGKVKEAAGRGVGNEKLTAEGRSRLAAVQVVLQRQEDWVSHHLTAEQKAAMTEALKRIAPPDCAP